MLQHITNGKTGATLGFATDATEIDQIIAANQRVSRFLVSFAFPVPLTVSVKRFDGVRPEEICIEYGNLSGNFTLADDADDQGFGLSFMPEGDGIRVDQIVVPFRPAGCKVAERGSVWVTPHAKTPSAAIYVSRRRLAKSGTRPSDLIGEAVAAIRGRLINKMAA